VRTIGDELALTPGIRAILRDLAPEIPLANVSTMRRVLQDSMGSERFTAGLFTGFAVLALLMAVVGLYGVLAYIVQQRSREIGIRMALGAARRQVFGDVLGRGMLLLALGIAAGQVLAFGAGRLVRSMLFETSASEPLVFALVVPALLVAGLLACALPAWRAMRGNPTIVLRAE
jgi:ABC-type antimicrobial peptide transport system permease subunit